MNIVRRCSRTELYEYGNSQGEEGAKSISELIVKRNEVVMKSSIKTCSVKSKRATGSTKLIICTAVILSLAFTSNSFAVPTLLTTLTGDTVDGGSALGSGGTLVTSNGNITFVGEFEVANGDPDLVAAGASGNAFNILDPGTTPGGQTAELFFSFDVLSLTFVYGGNSGEIRIQARDKDGGVVDDFYQASTYISQPAGPVTLSGSGIRSLYWEDTLSTAGKLNDYAALDNIEVFVDSVIPLPSAVVLAGIGVSFVGWLKKRKII